MMFSIKVEDLNLFVHACTRQIIHPKCQYYAQCKLKNPIRCCNVAALYFGSRFQYIL